MAHFYVLYNLVIYSPFVLEGLDEVSECDSDICIRLAASEDELAEQLQMSEESPKWKLAGRIEEIGHFLMVKGRELWIYPDSGVDIPLLQTYLLGPIFAVLLRQRGLLTLHASCVVVNEYGLAFLGDSGWGKSTLAAGFHQQGFPIFVDDLMALEMGQATPMVLPGLPWLKLWPTSASALGFDSDALPRLNNMTDKRYQRVRESAFVAPMPLGSIYLLREGNDFLIEELTESQAVVELVRHTRVAHLFATSGDLRTQFQHCTQLRRHVPVFRLHRPHGLHHIPQTVQMVLDHIRNPDNAPHLASASV